MEKGKRAGNLLERARVEEKGYNWVEAAGLYEQEAKSFLDKKMVEEAAEIHGQMGFCFFRAALQAETHKDFRSRMKLAVGARARAPYSLSCAIQSSFPHGFLISFKD